MPPDTFHAKARAALGTPFRLYGRSPDGVDCVGLVALIYGRADEAPIGYALRNAEAARWAAEIDVFAQRRADQQIDAGDIVLMLTGPAQLHLGVWMGESLIHADARIRRVVETPGPIQWPVLAAWHAPLGDE